MTMDVSDTMTATPRKAKRWPWVVAGLAALLAAFSTQVSLFVIQPIGALPEGRTLLVWRSGEIKLIDSADAICLRRMGGVSLLCRGMAMMQFIDPDDILLRMTCSETLYLISTDGKHFDR